MKAIKMSQFFKKLFSSDFPDKQPISSDLPNKKLALVDKNKDKLIDYFFDEINLSQYVKHEKADIILKHLTHEIDLLKSANVLSSEEKKSLGINPRLKITKDFIDILSDEGMKLEYPKEVLNNIYYRAFFKKSREEEYLKLKSLDIKNIKLMSSGVDDCKWCQKMQKKKALSEEEIRYFIDNKCQCEPYSKCYLEGEIKF